MNSKASTYLGMKLLIGSLRSTGKSIALGCRRPLYTLSGVSPCLHSNCRPKTHPLQRPVNSLYHPRPRYNVTVSTSLPACAAAVVLNPQHDEEGRLLQIDISPRAAKVGHFLFAFRFILSWVHRSTRLPCTPARNYLLFHFIFSRFPFDFPLY